MRSIDVANIEGHGMIIDNDGNITYVLLVSSLLSAMGVFSYKSYLYNI